MSYSFILFYLKLEEEEEKRIYPEAFTEKDILLTAWLGIPSLKNNRDNTIWLLYHPLCDNF